MTKRPNPGERIDALNRHNRPIRFEGDILARAFAPRQNALAAPAVEISADPFVCLLVNVEWVSHVLGVLETLAQPDAWQGDDTERGRAQNEILKLMEALMIGDACMIDPCCPETNDILNEIKILNQTMVNNLTLIVNNQTTIIEDNDTIISNQEIITQYQWQQIINQGNQYNQYLEILDDGESPQSFAPGVSENFSADALSEAQLCEAIKRYIDSSCENMRAFLTILGIVSVAASAAIGIALVLTGGLAAALAPFIGVALGALNTAALAVLAQAINDEDAKNRVRCCMFDSLKTLPITRANFEASVNDCGFDPEINDQALAAQLSAFINDINHNEGSYRAFVVELKTIQGNAQGVSTSPCECGCSDDLELVPFGAYAAYVQIIPMGNCVYRIIQNTMPATDHPTWYRAGIADLLGRPFTVDYPPEGYTLQGQGGSTVVGACSDPDYNGDNFGGGFVPSQKITSAHWWSGEVIDTFFTVNLVPEGECL